MSSYFSAESYCVHLTSQIYSYLQFYNLLVSTLLVTILHSLQLDDSGNLDCSVKIGGKMQKLRLNRHNKPSRSQPTSEQIVQSIKDDLINIKQRILKNIKENILDQCDEDTFYYCWSGLDLEIKVSIHIRINRLRVIVSRFCSERINVV